MLQKLRFFPQMGMKLSSSGRREMREGASKTPSRSRGGLLFFLAWRLTALALVGAWTWKKWGFPFGFQGFSSICVAYNLIVMLSLLFLGFTVSRLGTRCAELAEILGQFRKVPADRRNGFCAGGVFCVACGRKIPSWKGSPCEDLSGSKELIVDKPCSIRRGRRNYVGRNGAKEFLAEDGLKEKDEDGGGGGGLGGFSEDEEEDDIVNLRKGIAKERNLRAAALMELEKERKAASSAADEAMAKILLLQSEKALIEREARHYRQIAEQKHFYDQQVIESLQWVIEKLEAERDPGQKMMAAIQ